MISKYKKEARGEYSRQGKRRDRPKKGQQSEFGYTWKALGAIPYVCEQAVIGGTVHPSASSNRSDDYLVGASIRMV